MRPSSVDMSGRNKTLLLAAASLLAIVLIAGASLTLSPPLRERLRGRLSGSVVGTCVIQPGARCPDADLRNANLTLADLSDADLSRANLTGATLTGAELSSIKLIDADLTGANLRGAKLKNAKLSNAKLSGADLSDANLVATNLTGANLSGTQLEGANLEMADLRGANLSGAGLYRANLLKADLAHASLSGAVLCRTVLADGSVSFANCDLPSLFPSDWLTRSDAYYTISPQIGSCLSGTVDATTRLWNCTGDANAWDQQWAIKPVGALSAPAEPSDPEAEATPLPLPAWVQIQYRGASMTCLDVVVGPPMAESDMNANAEMIVATTDCGGDSKPSQLWHVEQQGDAYLLINNGFGLCLSAGDGRPGASLTLTECTTVAGAENPTVADSPAVAPTWLITPLQ